MLLLWRVKLGLMILRLAMRVLPVAVRPSLALALLGWTAYVTGGALPKRGATAIGSGLN